MRILTITLILTVTLLFSCSKNCECIDKNQYIPELYQTYWEGTFIQKTSDNEYTYQICISFEYEQRGDYIITDNANHNSNSIEGFFLYKKDQKILYIDNDSNGNVLTGNWFITNCTQESIVLEKGIMNDTNNSKLYLTKIY